MPGPFYFAWIADGTVEFDPDVHNVEELDQFHAVISQEEGDFASLSLEVKNPREGLLAPGRSQWCWFSWFDGAVLQPLFKGRIVGVPEQIHERTVTIEFTARPADYTDLKAALAETLKVRPFWDPAWLDEKALLEPDSVLEARTQLWHIDRVTHEVTVSDLLTGEDGTVTITASEHVYDEMSISYGSAPVRQVQVEATANWTQMGAGIVDLTKPIQDAFFVQGAPHYGLAASFSGDGLQNDWPKGGNSFGGGWTVHTTSLNRVDDKWFDTRYQRHDFYVEEKNDAGIITRITPATAWYPLWEFQFTLDVRYSVERDYTEVLTFEMNADVQSIVTDPDGDDVIVLTPKSQDLSLPIGGTQYPVPFPDGFVVPPGAVWYGSGYVVGGDLPIGDIGRRSFFATDRGKQSLDYLVMLARAHLLMRARAVEAKVLTTWAKGMDVSLRKDAVVLDPRLPGGQLSGKIVGYELVVDSSNGQMSCTVTVGCSIGRGDPIVPNAGDPSYAAPGYMAPGYQVMDGEDQDPLSGEVTYNLPFVEPVDDGLDFTHARASDLILGVTVFNGPTGQRLAIQDLPSPDPENKHQSILQDEDVYTRVRVRMRPVEGGPFSTPLVLTVSDLSVPKTIDLEAPVAP